MTDVSKTIWKTIWYVGLLTTQGSLNVWNSMLVDKDANFGPLLVEIGALSNFEVEKTGIEAHSSLGIAERYN